MDRMIELVNLLNKYAKEYYELDAPTVSDQEYDKLYDELLSLEKELGVVLPDSPTKRVGGAVNKGFANYKHKERLYSLDKTKTKEGVLEWLDRMRKEGGDDMLFTLEYKFDGLTLNLSYENGVLIRATTRGDGVEGEIVTEQALTVEGVLKTIPFTGKIDVLGECYMKLSALEEYNKTAQIPLKNARNAAAGGLRNLDPDETAKRKLSFTAYNIGYHDGITFKTQTEMHEFLLNCGFDSNIYFEVLDKSSDISALLDKAEENRPKLNFLIDGMVLKVDSVALRHEIGFTEKFPKWAIAYKFKAEEAVTTLENVIWQVSRTGKINPIACVTPVDIGGVTVKRATLSNISEIRRKDLMIGSKVFIRRSNDVIPEILGIAEHTDNSHMVPIPTVCPVCGSPVKQSGVFLYCTGKNCMQQIIESISHYASKDAMDIDGLSNKTVEQLIDDLGIKHPSDLYDLTIQKLLTLDGFKQKKAENLYNSIQKSKKTTLPRFLMGIGIANIGKKTASQMADSFKTLDNIRVATVDGLVALDDFGLIMANSVVDFFANSDNLKEIDKLIEKGIEFEKETVVENGVFSGKVVVITGTLQNYKRQEAQEKVKSLGGQVSDTVTKSVNLVVFGESAGSKLDKAKKLGIELIDEQDFIKMINQGE